MPISQWDLLELRLKRAIEDSIIFGTQGNISQIRKELCEYLGIENGTVFHPTIGSLKLKIVTGKAKHANVTVSMTPRFHENWSSKRLLRECGIPDSNGHNFSLRKAIKFDSGNLRLTENGNLIELSHNDDVVGYWELLKILDKFSKQANILYCKIRLNQEKNPILHSASIVKLKSDLLRAKFRQFVEGNRISPEFRMYLGEDHEHCWDRGISPGSVRDHGFGWRLKSSLQSDLYLTDRIAGGD